MLVRRPSPSSRQRLPDKVEHSSGHDEEQIGWARETPAAIESWAGTGGYFNYIQADEPIERVRAAFRAAAFERLRALKRRYEPDNRRCWPSRDSSRSQRMSKLALSLATNSSFDVHR